MMVVVPGSLGVSYLLGRVVWVSSVPSPPMLGKRKVILSKSHRLTASCVVTGRVRPERFLSLGHCSCHPQG